MNEHAPQAALAIVTSIVEYQANFNEMFFLSFFSRTKKAFLKAAQMYEIFHKAAAPEVEEDNHWMRGVHGLSQFLARKNAIQHSLSMKMTHIELSLNAWSMFKTNLRYASGIIEKPLKFLNDAKLTKPIPARQPLQRDGKDRD